MNELSEKSERRFRRFGILTIASVFILIFVGGLVRSTGSGMGCPDWPKCFGTWVPPTDVSQLPADYKDRFRVEGHEIADFDVYKTWTEYVNRLIGVLIGFFIFLTVFFAIPYLKKDKSIFWLSFAAFLLVGFQGWIGSKVVSSNLAHWMVTIHMIIALVIVGLLIFTITRSQNFTVVQLKADASLKPLMVLILSVSGIQTISGTQVRENIDSVALIMGEQNREYWIQALGGIFSFHRTFSIVSLVLTMWMIKKFRENFDSSSLIYRLALSTIILVAMQILSGKVLDNLGFPKMVQSLHLFVGSLIGGAQLFITILLFSKTQTLNKG
ncbi:MAG: COX15/CtaA family protein [Bacteroidota bacterium]|jgi:cytochrome c oxidase assembly protein subunit 15|nr:COX15/CtaA family protein [Sphingobacteriales bacterium]